MAQLKGKSQAGNSIISDTILKMNTDRQFWLSYCAGWTVYGASLAAVFRGVGYPLNIGLLWTVLCNVLPGFLLGIGVIFICRRFSWGRRTQPQFILLHTGVLILFSFAWCFLTLLDLSILTFLQRGTWSFAIWDVFGLQWQLFTGVLACIAIMCSVYITQINENLRSEELRNAELTTRAAKAEAAQSSAELAVLRSKLNPHFLFNTLHSLMALVRSDAKTAEEAIERFASMLRYVLQSEGEKRSGATDVTFTAEWNFVEDYLELERLRLGDRLRLTTKIEPSADAYVLPAFSLQPIVENAVRHAVATRANGGHITIRAHDDRDRLYIEVSDDGTNAPGTSSQEGNGMGLRLVRESLEARFGPAASFNAEAVPHEGFKVSIAIPRAAEIPATDLVLRLNRMERPECYEPSL